MRRAQVIGAEDEGCTLIGRLCHYQDETRKPLKYRHLFGNFKRVRNGSKCNSKFAQNLEDTKVGDNDEDECRKFDPTPNCADKARDCLRKSNVRASGTSSMNDESLARMIVKYQFEMVGSLGYSYQYSHPENGLVLKAKVSQVVSFRFKNKTNLLGWDVSVASNQLFPSTKMANMVFKTRNGNLQCKGESVGGYLDVGFRDGNCCQFVGGRVMPWLCVSGGMSMVGACRKGEWEFGGDDISVGGLVMVFGK
ncbi:hypothetical protein Tco_1299847 [Tanacetum coccineum]